MDALVLYCRDEPVCEYVLDSRPLEVGRGAFCDIVVHDPAIAERELLVQRSASGVVSYDLRRGGRLDRGRPFPPGEALPIGGEHRLVRLLEVPRHPAAGTEPVVPSAPCSSRLSLVIGRGAEARRVALGTRPVTIGSASDNDVVLLDRAVSAHHCRVELGEGAAVVRDLQSRNGTWIDGVSVIHARLVEGSMLRVGRTDLVVVPRGQRGDARSDGMIAVAPDMLRVLGQVERHARLDWPVLIQGESGTGKEGIAQALHSRGPRAKRPWVALNAGGLPRELVESELFGHERGAFTGAVAAHKGAFEQAHGGTLFLDEIGELPLDLQARLLRVLESWEIRRIGSESPIRVDVRLVCATHRDLRSMVAAGSFRQDLYYRVARLIVEVPPLRQRPEDIVALADHFLETIAGELGRRTLSSEARACLLAHCWPGNVRELRNVLGAAAAATAGMAIEAREIERAIDQIGAPSQPYKRAVANLEQVLQEHRGNVSAAARALGIPRSTLRDRLREARAEAAQRTTKPA